MRHLSRNIAAKCSVLAAAAALVAGCGVELEGEEGNFSFEYVNVSGQSAPSDGALAVGTQIDVRVNDARDGEDDQGDDQQNDDEESADQQDADDGADELTLTDAYSDDAAVLDVVDQSDSSFRLAAHDEGPSEGTTIHAEAEDGDGEEVADSVSIRTAPVDQVETSPSCPDDALFLPDTRAEFDYAMLDAGGNRLTGFGHYPVAVEPSEGGSIVEDHEVAQELIVDIGPDTGSYDLVADGVGGDPTQFEVVDGEDIDNLRVLQGDEADDEDEQVTIVDSVGIDQEGLVTLFYLEVDDNRVCSSIESVIEIDVDDPDVCEARGDFGVFGTSDAGVMVEGVGEGECEIELSVVDSELSETYSVEVGEE